MEKSAGLLLEKLRTSGGKYPEKWKTTPYKSCFLFSDSPAIMICQYLDVSDTRNISVSSVDENGNTLTEVIINEGTEPDSFESYLNLYENVKGCANSNDFKSLAGSVIA